MWVYINYPNARITVHSSPDCSQIAKHKKRGQRWRKVTLTSLSQIIHELRKGDLHFGATASTNDLWIDVSIGNQDQNLGLLHVIHAVLCNRYTRFEQASINTHDCH